MTGALRLRLHHIWLRGKPRPSIELARARWTGPGSRLANEDHWSSSCPGEGDEGIELVDEYARRAWQGSEAI
jgi:hypothetical protein